MFTGVFNSVDVLEISCAGTKILPDLQIVIIFVFFFFEQRCCILSKIIAFEIVSCCQKWNNLGKAS